MTALVIVLVSLLAYLLVGFCWAAPNFVRGEMDRNLRDYKILADDPGRVEEWRRTSAAFAIGVALIWPLWAVNRLLAGAISARVGLSSEELKRANLEQAKRIAALERELGLDNS